MRQSGCHECRALDDGQADQRIEAWCITYPSVVTVAAIATFPSGAIACSSWTPPSVCRPTRWICSLANSGDFAANRYPRSEEHTSELQSRGHLVCRLLLEKKKT